jgi:hypothetical protein
MSKLLDEMRIEVKRAQRRLAAYEAAATKYPDMRMRLNHRGDPILMSRSVNSLVTEVETLPQSTFPHSPCVVTLYLIDDDLGMQVYSDPPTFLVGHRPEGNEVYGEVPDPLWNKRMQDAEINPGTVSKVASYLMRHPPVSEESPE